MGERDVKEPGTIKSMYQKGRDTGEMLSHGFRRTAKVVTGHEGAVVDGAKTAVEGFGKFLGNVGQVIGRGSRFAQGYVKNNLDEAAEQVQGFVTGGPDAGATRQFLGKGAKIATQLGGNAVVFLTKGVELTGQGIEATGDGAVRIAPGIAGAAGGTLRGTATAAADAVDAAGISSARIDELRAEFEALGRDEVQRGQARLQDIETAAKRNRRGDLLELLTVGGVSLANVLRHPGEVPADVERAFALAYPHLALHENFAQAVDGLSTQELMGFVSGVKGKLFEIQLVDHFNHGYLPDGYHAELAMSATQPGWDIRIVDAHGHVDQLIQAKATESAQYVHDALVRYPDIDVTTTSEVHAQLVARGLAEHVHNSGIAEHTLQTKVEMAAAAHGSFDLGDLAPSSIGLAVIAMSVLMSKRGESYQDIGTEIGERASRTTIMGLGAKGVMIVTHNWWLGLALGVGSNWLASQGREKRQMFDQLSAALTHMRARRDRLDFDLQPGLSQG